MRTQPASIRTKLFILILSVAAVSLLSSYCLSAWTNYLTLKKEMVESFQVNARLVGENCIAPLTFEDKAQALEMLKKLETIKTIEAVRLYSRDERLFAFQSWKKGLVHPDSAPSLTPGVFRKGSLHVVLPINYKGDRCGIIAVQASTGELKEKSLDLLIRLLPGLVCLLILSGIAAFWLQKFVSAPILHLVDITETISGETDKSFRIKEERRDEIGRLYSAYNAMLDRLAQHEQMRDKAEQDLRLGEQKFRNLVESITDCFWEVDAELRVTYMSPIFEQLTGNSTDNILGQGLETLSRQYKETHDTGHANPSGAEEFLSRAVAAMSTKKSFVMVEDSFIRKDEKEVILESSGTPILDENNRFLGYRGITRDITEQRALEKKLRQAHKMEAIGTLAGGIAHDFNNVLGVILGSAEMGEEMVEPGTPIHDTLENILAAANRAKDLVAQILAFSRQTEAERVSLMLQPIIKESVKLLRSSIPSTIEIICDMDPKCGTVGADPTEIHQIIMNLCTNAYHAMEETGGLLKVILKETMLQDCEDTGTAILMPGRYAELTISDTGHGIDPAIQDRIFEPFFTTKGVGKGTGMGLAMVHGIIKSYAGDISLESSSEHGTSFRIHIPLNDSIEAARVDEVQDAVPTGEESILFVDDEPLLARLGKSMLERLGYTVATCKNGLDALRTFQEDPDRFDLVITDQTMPGLTGSSLARQLLQVRPDLPIILCTGYSSSSVMSRQQAASFGIREFVLKPIKKNDIARLVRKVLDNRK